MIRLNLFNKTCAPIEELPNEMLGKIIKRMIPMNPGGLPTALKALQSLSQTSKRIYSVVHSDYVNALVIDTILNQHHDVPTHLFHRLGMTSLRKYIRRNALDQVFKSVLDMYSVILESLKRIRMALKNQVNYFALSRLKDHLVEPKYCLVLFSPYCCSRKIQVFHPFGSTSVLSSQQDGDLDVHAVAMISKAIIELLNGSFQGIFEKRFLEDTDNFELIEVQSECECFEVILSEQDEDRSERTYHIDIKEVERRDLKTKKGGQQLIFSRKFFVFSCYRIYSSFGEMLLQHRGGDNKLRCIISEMLHFESSLDGNVDDLKDILDKHLRTTLVNMLANHRMEAKDFIWTEMEMKRIAHI